MTNTPKSVLAQNPSNAFSGNSKTPTLRFLSFTLIIKGKYANYQLARNTLIRVIPSISIPLEQIVMQPQQSDVEMKVVFDIPFINQ